ncbi:hypothetical protein [Streptomyces jumonjinensis]|uniref:Uncharacterized protein n=1 Tax=Streptomyces jumonjinensis TaxID=1945 RepID=A0A646KNJ9_STRJU|nr:hypothetical protein [Streptomyces jumonjinensis]MQT03894.1 hypothetical protein [Streptomyces jumonjinensis]
MSSYRELAALETALETALRASMQAGRGEPLQLAQVVSAAGWVAPETTAGLAVEPWACAECGTPEDGHGSRWVKSVGLHQWTRPSERIVLERMRARRARRELGRLRARVAELEAELLRPQGQFPEALLSASGDPVVMRPEAGER